ncbi:MAG: hypothetical protein ACLPXB_07575 [Thiobacillaceae bacterium]
MALVVALIVASSATRREQRISAILLVSDVMQVRAAYEHLTRLAKEKKVAPENYPMWVANYLSWRHPRLSVLFESNMARVVSIDARLGAHLSLFRMAYTSLEEHLARVREDAQRLLEMTSQNLNPPRNPQATATDAKVVADALALAAEHAAYAQYFLSELVLSPVPGFIKRIRMRAWPSDMDRQSKKLLTDPKHRQKANVDERISSKQ